MKLQRPFRPDARPNRRRPATRGMATIIFIMLMAIMMILVTAEMRALIHLRQEVKLLEKQQTQRLNAPPTHPAAVAPAP
jgi:hypothetical protein